MPNPQNLKSFPKGVSGNPKGRPKGESMTAVLRRMMEEEAGSEVKKLAEIKAYLEGKGVKKITNKEALILRTVARAFGNSNIGTKMTEVILDRLDGKPKQEIEASILAKSRVQII